MSPLQAGRAVGKKAVVPVTLGFSSTGATDGGSTFQTSWAFTTSAVLASPGTLVSLHTIVQWTSGTPHVKALIFSDSSGVPGTLVHATPSLALATAGGNQDLSETGLSIALAAGTYWLGLVPDTTSTGQVSYKSTGGSSNIATSGYSFASPGNWPGGGTAGTRSYLAYAIVNT